MKNLLSILALLILANLGLTQDNNWMTFPAKNGDTLSKSQQLDYNNPDGTVEVDKDARIDKIDEFLRSGEESLDGVLIDGFRVMIYFNQDKSKAEQQKAQFMQMYDDHQAYIDYMAPNYRVRVGNFRTRLEAEKLKQEVLGLFTTAIVVEDKIQLPQLDPVNNE